MNDSARFFHSSDPLELSSGKSLPSFDLCFESFGTLNADGSNAILVCHALSGDSHVAKHSPDDKEGWWEALIGPGKALDTTRYYIVCSNTLGSCYGSTGPTSLNPETQTPYLMTFPVITITDMVRAQYRLMSFLGISKWHTVLGGSMGGMQALLWSILYPQSLVHCIALAVTPFLSPQALAFSAISRNAILSDVAWHKGAYTEGASPEQGLSIARMIGHITYLSEASMEKKFGRRLQDKTEYSYDFGPDFQVESYLKHQGDKFVKRFDANSYLYLSKAMSYFDLEKQFGSLSAAFSEVSCRYLFASITSDMLYTSAICKEMVRTLIRLEKDVSFLTVDSPYGHDAFLIETQVIGDMIRSFLGGVD